MDLQTIIPAALKASVLLNVFALGLRASARDTIHLFRRPGELSRALLAMNVLMPLFAFGVVSLVDLSPPVKIALVALSISPIPPLLPKKMVKAGGTPPYVTGLLVTIGLLAIVFVPLVIEVIERLTHQPLQMSVGSIARMILVMALLPIALGIAVRSMVPAIAERIAGPVGRISSIALFACVAAILFVAAPAAWSLVGNGTLAVLAAFVVVGLAAGFLLGGPDRENRTALAIAASSRHPGIAIAIAQTNFPEQKLAMAAVLLYLIVNAVISFPFLRWARRGQPVG